MKPIIINQTILLDRDGGEIRHLDTGLVFQLGANEVELLMCFIENQGELLERQVLINKVWESRGVFVEDGSLMQAISMCRRALQDSRGEIILTERGKGYRFVGNCSIKSTKLPKIKKREGVNVNWKGNAIGFLVYLISAVCTFFLYSSYNPALLSLTDHIAISSFSSCNVNVDGREVASFVNGTRYEADWFTLLVGEGNASLSLPTSYQEVKCDD